MTSSQPVATPNALNFTPDNKHCYAYSGAKDSSGTATNYLDFITNSEYIDARIQPVYFAQGTNNVSWLIKFNGVSITYAEVTSGRDYTPFQELFLIIPPFTHVEVEVDNLSGGSESVGVVLVGKVYGMTSTGYQ